MSLNSIHPHPDESPSGASSFVQRLFSPKISIKNQINRQNTCISSSSTQKNNDSFYCKKTLSKSKSFQNNFIKNFDSKN